MIYLFENEAGEVVELDFPIGKAPKIGDSFKHSGQKLTRIPVAPEAKVAPNAKFVSHSLPRWWPHAKDHEPGTGKPRFDNIHQVRNSVARSKDTEKDRVIYD
jgi:hypothetical protein